MASLLDETLEEEKDTDEALTQIAESSVNLRAARRLRRAAPLSHARPDHVRSKRRSSHRQLAVARTTPK